MYHSRVGVSRTGCSEASIQGRRVAGGPARCVCSVWFDQSSERCPGRRKIEEGEGTERKGEGKEREVIIKGGEGEVERKSDNACP